MTYINDEYRDRGMKKWAGFYLSEHTAEQEKNKMKSDHVNLPKSQMLPEEIGAVLEEATIKHKQVGVQLKVINDEGHFHEDIVGFVTGVDSLGICVGKIKINYDDIRHIKINQTMKWSHLP